MTRVRNVERHNRKFADRFSTGKDKDCAENHVSQSLQCQRLDFCPELTGWSGISHYWRNECNALNRQLLARQ